MENERQFTRTYINDDNTTCVWKYDLDKSVTGPIETTCHYPKNYLGEANSKLNKTNQKYINPANGKEIAYGRYKQLVKEGKIYVKMGG
jgi:hypothetical protein